MFFYNFIATANDAAILISVIHFMNYEIFMLWAQTPCLCEDKNISSLYFVYEFELP